MSSAMANILVVFVLLTCVFAFWKGGSAERAGAGIILANLLAGIVNEAVFHEQLATLSIDGLTAVALLAVAVRYASIWLGAVMLLYAAQFALHAVYAVQEHRRDMLHMLINNIDFFAVSLCLGAGTILAWRRRARLVNAPAA